MLRSKAESTMKQENKLKYRKSSGEETYMHWGVLK